jgi:hypothetical protein
VTTVETERDQARRLVSQLVKRGALIVSAGCPLVQAAGRGMAIALAAGTLRGCPHRAAERGVALTVIPMYGFHETAFGPHCHECFQLLPAQTVCQVCLRAPSPGLRTVLHWDRRRATVLIGRLCRDCRPGRVS